jgi:hypothetical protein
MSAFFDAPVPHRLAPGTLASSGANLCIINLRHAGINKNYLRQLIF